MKEIFPNIKSIGVFLIQESNAVTPGLLKEGGKNGIEIIEAVALSSEEVLAATNSIVSRADVLYAPTDNTVASNIEGLIHAANPANTPVLGGAVRTLKKALSRAGFDYYQVGVQTADYVVAILQDAAPGKIDVKFAQGSDLVINKSAAIRLGISYLSVLSRASMIK